jgi:hypothetical protein
MKKAECEKAIRHLCHQWAKGLSDAELEHPSFSAFKTWLSQNHYSLYLDFPSTAGSDYDAERWFDQVQANVATMIPLSFRRCGRYFQEGGQTTDRAANEAPNARHLGSWHREDQPPKAEWK